jgi:hypothetical protein
MDELAEADQKILPSNELGNEDFVLSQPIGMLAARLPGNSAQIPARPLAMARLCVEVYKEAKRLEREQKMAAAGEDEERRTWNEYGVHFVVVCPVAVTPVGSDGTWVVYLRTSHVNAATHPGLLRTTFVFNEGVTDLNKPSRSLKYDWVIAEKDGHYVIVGNRDRMGAISEKDTADKLAKEGYINMGIISIAEEDRRVGFLVK